MKIKYSTKEICKIFDINRETLRHYERMGILNPYINPENGYREYSYWDVGSIIDVLKYRSLGFSLADAKDAIFEHDFPQIVDDLEKHSDYLTNQIILYNLLRKKATKDLEKMRNVQDHLNVIGETDTEDFYFIPYTIDPSDPGFKTMQNAFNHSEFFTTAILVDGQDRGHDNYGLLTEKAYADILKIGDGITIEGAHVVFTIADVVGRERVSESIVDDFRDKITAKYGREFDKICAVLITRFYDKEKRYHQYFFLFSKLG